MPKRTAYKNIALLLLIVSIFLFAFFIFSGTRGRSTARSLAAIDCHRAELNLRAADAINILPNASAFDMSEKENDTAEFIAKLKTGKAGVLAAEVKHDLEKAAEDDSHDPRILAKKIVLESELDQSTSEDWHRLENIDTSENNAAQVKTLLPVFRSLYKEDEINVKQPANKIVLTAETQADIEKILGTGWFKERALVRLCKLGQQTKQYTDLIQEIKDKSWSFVLRLAVLGFGIIIFGLAGLLVVIWQLFFYHRESSNLSFKADYGWVTVLIVFCSWFSTQLLLGLLSAWLKKLNIINLSGSHSLIVSATIAMIYLLSNGPALIYIYLFALKPKKISFLKGINWQFGNGYGSPPKLFGIACLAWMAAIPLVLFSYLLSVKLFHAGGSSNPIIGIVMEAANKNNFGAILLFYSTLGIMAPFVEESLFRGFFYSFLRSRYNPILSNIISAGLFAVAHLDPGAVLPLFCLGSIFAYLFETTGSIVPSVIAHGLWNSGTFTLVLLLFGT